MTAGSRSRPSPLIDRIRDEWYPAWDLGDAARFQAVTRDVFAPDAAISPKPHAPASTVDQLLPGWCRELETWRPMRHEILFGVEDGNSGAWTMRWEATHSGPLHLADGRVVPATGRTVTAEAGFFARWDGRRLTQMHSYSDFYGMTAELDRLAQGS